MADDAWTWDQTLFAGTARYYAQGRTAYPPALAVTLARALRLDGTGRLLDVGCGPGSVALLLAPHYEQVIGVDADPDMLVEAARLAEKGGIHNAVWRQLRAEELPADIPPVRTAVFAQSFHWMDRPLVARTVRDMLAPDGALVHVGATTHRGNASDAGGVQPPYDAVSALVRRYLGPAQRAGQGVLRNGTAGGENAVYRDAGFIGPEHLELPARVVTRTVEEVAASIFSLSSSAPHLFGAEFSNFSAELLALLRAASGGASFTEEIAPIGLDIWR